METGPTARALSTIVATVGPASREPEHLRELLDAGVDVLRLNMAHGCPAEHEVTVDDIRRLSAEIGRPVGILVDLAGPKIRLGQLADDPLRCEEGAEFRIVRGDVPRQAAELVTSYAPLVDELSVGDRVLLADGLVSMRVVDKQPDSVCCRVTGAGTIRSRQGINLPGANLSLAAMSDVDREHAVWAAGCGIDFVGLSFVSKPEEIHELRELLRTQGSRAMVVAKIERREAVDRLDDIVAAADAVMVARGDLGVEIDVATTPVVQKRIIDVCRRHHRPVIVATQMLDSMQHSRRPTRAEVSDVANAILDGADACMLSGETAVGEFPLEAVKMMNRVMLHAEELLRDAPARPESPPSRDVHPVTAAVVSGAGQIARRLDARLVVVASRSGATARIKAKQRDFIPTIGVSDSESTLRRMCLFWGITPIAGAPTADVSALREFIDTWGRANDRLRTADRVVFITGSQVVPHGHNLIVVHEVEPTALM